MKKLLPLLPYILAAIFAFFAVRSCGGPDAKYWVKKTLYDQAAKDAAVQHVVDMATIVTQDGTIAAKNAAISEKQGRIDILLGHAGAADTVAVTLKAENKRLRENAQAAIDANPALQALVANFDLQIKTSDETIMNLRAVIILKDGIIADWSAKFDAQVTISETWKAAYEREHRLRLTAEELNITLEHQRDASRLYGKFTTAGLAAAGAYLVINAIAK